MVRTRTGLRLPAVSVSLTPDPRQLAFDHGPAVGLNLAILAHAETAYGEEIDRGQKDNGHQKDQHDSPVNRVDELEVLFLGVQL